MAIIMILDVWSGLVLTKSCLTNTISPILQNTFFFMNSETFEEIPVSDKVVDDKVKWITEGSEISLVLFKDKIIEVVVPSTAVYEVVETEPNMKGNTAQGYTKPATLSSGAVISVPGFVEQGAKIKVDTDKGEYIERVNE
jgi:elongation factor P